MNCLSRGKKSSQSLFVVDRLLDDIAPILASIYLYTLNNSRTGMMWNCKALSPPPPYQFRKCSSVIVYQHG